MRPLLVRDAMTIGVPVCRDDETCGAVAERLRRQKSPAEVVVALDDDGMACGWLARADLETQPAGRPVGEVMDEDIPTVAPEASLESAVRLMRGRGVSHLLLMHDWPGEPRPSAVISLQAAQARLDTQPGG